MTFQRFNMQLIIATASCVIVLSLSSATPAQELVGYWQLEETDFDAEAVDSSGNGLNGFYDGEVDPDVEGAPGFGSGAWFDGQSGKVVIGPGDETGFGDLTSDFTVMAWINPEQFDSKNRVFGSSPHGGAGWGWGTVRDELELTTWGVKDYDQPVPLELDEWAHAAVVLDDNFEAHFYVNGEFIGTQTHPSEGNPTINEFSIGFACCGDEYFQGRLDEVGVFSGSLTEEQIVNAMNLGVANYDGVVGEVLRPGDADQDFDFDQLDLVQVQVAAKYLTGEAATWGEGDWNGGPGGTQGNPPAGDGQFNQLDIIAALGEDIYLTGPYAALQGSAGAPGDEQTSLVYDPSDGSLGVNPPVGTDLTSINITSAGSKFIGDKPAVLDGAFDNFAADNIFKATFGGSFGEITFGAVLPMNLTASEVVDDLSAVGSLAGGGDLGDVDLIYVPEPASLATLLLGMLFCLRRRR